jgi:hypothetical protein
MDKALASRATNPTTIVISATHNNQVLLNVNIRQTLCPAEDVSPRPNNSVFISPGQQIKQLSEINIVCRGKIDENVAQPSDVPHKYG